MDISNINKLTVFRTILEDSLVKKIIRLHQEDRINKSDESLYYQVLGELLEKAEPELLYGHLWQNYLLTLLVKAENIFTLTGERVGGEIKGQLYDLAVLDIENILQLYNLDWQELRINLGINDRYKIENFPNYLNDFKKDSLYLENLEGLKEKFSTGNPYLIVEALSEYYHQWGCGDFSRYRFFRWEREKGLVGISNFDSVTLQNLVGYQYQKEIILKNTEAFIQGNHSNNVLLFGDKGTGKSSTVKALGNKYFSQGLRIIELSKGNIMEFPKLVEKTRYRALRFIVFLDDLSFEEFEVEYKHIKAMIEGGLEIRPQNMLIYATSNRRHLIKESWSDQQNSGEIRISDSVQEKLSLADRFGMTITFGTPDQQEYLEIVDQLALKNGINLPEEELHHRALQWELWYHGRSGRTAQQFINYLLGEMGK